MTSERPNTVDEPIAEERPKRSGPTIDLDPSAVSGDTQTAGETAARLRGRTIAERLIPPLSGAVAALLVVGVLWLNGLISERQPPQATVAPAQLESVAANVGELSSRVARVEASAARPASPVADPAMAARAAALEQSLADLRDELAQAKQRSAAAASAVDELKSALRDANPAPDLAPLTERLTRLDQAVKTLADAERRSQAASGDTSVRRLAIASALDAAVRDGAPYQAALAAAKQIAGNPQLLVPLEPFAAKGVPDEASYLRELLGLLQQIARVRAEKAPASAAKENSATDKPLGQLGLFEWARSRLTSLVRVERVDAVPAGASETAKSLEAVARGNDLAAVKRDLAKLPQADDPRLQAWIKTVDARDAALAASRQFAAEALAATAQSGQ